MNVPVSSSTNESFASASDRGDAALQRGAVLITTVMAMMLLSAVGGALVLVASTSALISANAGAANETFYAAEAVFERTVAELRSVPELTPVLDGTRASMFTDGPPSGLRTLADGTTLSLSMVVSLANCQRRSGCAEADLNAALRGRPWGERNPRWRLFAHGPLDPAPAGLRSGLPIYVVAMVADDQAETDGDPSRDGQQAGVQPNPGAGRLLIRVEAFGRRASHRVVEGTILRQDLAERAVWAARDPLSRGSAPSTVPELHVLSWHDGR